MTAQQLKPYTVYLRRKGGKTHGRITVQAVSDEHAGRVAKDQIIEVSYPKSKRSHWVVTGVEART
jgi:hypothetical protein